MKISAVICTRNRPNLIGSCLDALIQNQCEGLEMVVADQSVDGRTREIVESKGDPRIKYVHTSTVGLSKARNIGVRESSGEIIAFTDDDCIPDSDWAEKIVKEFDKRSDLSALFGQSIPSGNVPGERLVAVKMSGKYRNFAGRHNPWNLGHGCNMAFRRGVFKKVGMFDELLGPGGVLRNSDDADFTYRLLTEGFTACYCPEVRVHHQQFRHGNALWDLEKDYGIGAGAFYWKHLKCGDAYMLKLMLERWIKGGAFHIGYGLITFNSSQLRLGWYRILYSIIGMRLAKSIKVSKKQRLYVEFVSGGAAE